MGPFSEPPEWFNSERLARDTAVRPTATAVRILRQGSEHEVPQPEEPPSKNVCVNVYYGSESKCSGMDQTRVRHSIHTLIHTPDPYP